MSVKLFNDVFSASRQHIYFYFQSHVDYCFSLNSNHMYQSGFDKSDQLLRPLKISIIFYHPDK